MKKDVFRPVAFWKSAVMTMPDNSFFELMRNVFGKIKTPFNKQQLLDDLEMFLLRKDIQKTIAAYIDENDAKVIAAVALFGEPAPGELESFFSGELSCARLQDVIVNLEERFILYRFTGGKTSRLALNPVLEQVLLPITADISPLFPAVSAGEAASAPEMEAKSGNAVILNDRILAGLLSFVSQKESFFRAEGVIRKHVVEAGKTCFPGIDLEGILGSLQMLGLFYVEEDRLVPDRKRFDEFGSLSARARMEYCAAALIVHKEINPPLNLMPPLFRGRIRETANFIHGFLDSLDTELLYTERTIARLIEIISAEAGTGVTCGAMIEAMEKTGLIAAVSPEFKRLGPAAKTGTANSECPSIAVDSGFSVLVYPEINYPDVIKLAAFMNIKEAGAVVRFELETDSVVRAFDENIGADEIIEHLKRLSGGRVDDTFVWNIKEWGKRHSEVSLKKGVVLTLAEDRRYLMETMPLAAMIDETLAPGVYLLGEDALSGAAAALHSAGIDIIAHRREKNKNAGIAHNYFPPPSSFVLPVKIPAASAPSVPRQDNASVLTAEFHAILKNMSHSEIERAELSARIDRRLVLCEAQLKDASIRYEKLEARHMDYAGKQNIAKQAIAQQSPVEIVWPGAGREKSIFGIPRTLEKKEGEVFLLIMPDGEREVIRVPLAKVSLLRRIKKSIFEI
ncbi:MAG: hypothetical protein LBQ89_05225 [Treponema sp.]|jgi:hypothetical protein|nr:hypothetical protein [Treponema sp.]